MTNQLLLEVCVTFKTKKINLLLQAMECD